MPDQNGQRYNYDTHTIAQQFPLAEFCELCPEDDKRRATARHHPDYDYPEIFVSCCNSCHRHQHILPYWRWHHRQPRDGHGETIHEDWCKEEGAFYV